MQDSVTTVFVEQAQRHFQKDFMPKIRDCLERLSDDQLWWRPNSHSNSIGNILLHLSGNVRQWILSGLGGEPDDRNRDGEFEAKGPIPGPELMRRLERTVEEACQVIASLDREQLLREKPIQVYEVSGLQAVFHVVEHFSYHLGQITYVTKMLEDVDLAFYDL